MIAACRPVANYDERRRYIVRTNEASAKFDDCLAERCAIWQR